MKKIAKMILLVALAINLTACIEVVETGQTGIKKVFGEVEKTPYDAGMYFYNPFTTSMFTIDNKEQRIEQRTTVYTKDVQQAEISYVINYYLAPDRTIDIVSTVGTDYERKLIPQVLNGSIKNVTGKWDAIDLISSREKATQQIQDAIGLALERKGIIVTVFQLTDIEYQPKFEDAVESKVTAVQRAEEAKNNTIRIEEEAKQRIVTAEADAKAMTIKTEALKKSQSLVLYEAVQKWDGVMPKIVTGDAGTLLNVPQNFSE